MSTRAWQTGAIVVTIVACWAQVGVLQIWPIAAESINLVLCLVLVVAFFRSWVFAAGLAAGAGILLSQFSVWPLTYPLAFIGTVVGTWLIVQRWIATRSTASLIAAPAIATVIFHGLVAIGGWLNHTVNQISVAPDWTTVIRTVMIQSAVHPLIIYLIWRRRTGGSFARTSFKQSF